MKKLPTIMAIMSPFPHSIEGSQSLSQASLMMRENNVNHLPVTDIGQLIGVVSTEDLKIGSSAFVPTGASVDLIVKDVCSSKIYLADIYDPLEAVLRVMSEKHVDSAIVMKNDKLAGILTHSDICRSYAELLAKLSPNSNGDDAA
ncbi:hypothetical protein A9Q81_19750 [Gammaproteobacteria bacterium 42_54_T18]|nr:hypothetical protein A9Q81_19750 [Gammaproteobacteria bacterium 42_54_T18]